MLKNFKALKGMAKILENFEKLLFGLKKWSSNEIKCIYLIGQLVIYIKTICQLGLSSTRY